MMVAPCTVKAATKKVREWHRHLPDIQGGLFAAQCLDAEGNCVGVAIAGNPARVWQDQAKLVIARVATTGAENACSILYGSLCRAAKALGYREVWTYTLPHEPGTSLRAAGFIDMGMTAGGEHDRPSRARKPAVNADPKRRWLRRLSAETASSAQVLVRASSDPAAGKGVKDHDEAQKETARPQGSDLARDYRALAEDHRVGLGSLGAVNPTPALCSNHEGTEA